MAKKIAVVKVHPVDCGPGIVFRMDTEWAGACEAIKDLLDNGDTVVASPGTLTKAEIESLPEHEGW